MKKETTDTSTRIGLVIFCGIVATLFEALCAYVYFINGWAVVILLVVGVFLGIPSVLALCVLAAKRHIGWRTFAYFSILWFLVWVTLSRPHGILNSLQAREAKELFFLPPDAVRTEVSEPHRQSRAVVSQSCFSRLTRSELLTFYSNRAVAVGFTIVGVRTNQMQVTGAFFPWTEIRYRNRKGRHCEVMIYENVPYAGLQDTRHVRQAVEFSPALGPPVVGL